MDASSGHVVIIGGPDSEAELLVMSLDDGQAVPLFDSVEEARTFLRSLGTFADDWSPAPVGAQDLAALLDYQDETVRYVALSPPPEDPTGGMEVRVVERELLANLLRNQSEPPEAEPPEDRRSFFRRVFGRRG